MKEIIRVTTLIQRVKNACAALITCFFLFHPQLTVPANITTPKSDDLATVVPEGLPNDLSTMDMAAFASLSNEDAVCPQPLTPATPVTPVTPATPAPRAESTVLPLSLPVSEDVIRSCVTPRKVQNIKQALEKETQRHKCALKLLPYFFTKEELTKSNTDGSQGKEQLDSTKLNSVKVLVFSKFPLECPVEKEKIWKGIKGKINGKCRASKFAYAFRES